MESAVYKLNEYANKTSFLLQYEDLGSVGPDHDKTFTQRVVLNGKVYPEGVGKTKKEAKQDAAKNALRDAHQDGAHQVLKHARKQILPTDFSQVFQEENLIIKKMLHEKPEERPKASDLKAQLDKLAQTQHVPPKSATV